MAFEGLLISGSLIKVISYTLLYSRVASLPEQQRPMESHWDPFGPISIPFPIWTVLSRLLNLLNSFYLLIAISKSITIHSHFISTTTAHLERVSEWLHTKKLTLCTLIPPSYSKQTKSQNIQNKTQKQNYMKKESN